MCEEALLSVDERGKERIEEAVSIVDQAWYVSKQLVVECMICSSHCLGLQAGVLDLIDRGGRVLLGERLPIVLVAVHVQATTFALGTPLKQELVLGQVGGERLEECVVKHGLHGAAACFDVVVGSLLRESHTPHRTRGVVDALDLLLHLDLCYRHLTDRSLIVAHRLHQMLELLVLLLESDFLRVEVGINGFLRTPEHCHGSLLQSEEAFRDAIEA